MRFQTFYDPVGLYFMSPLDLHEERLDSLPAPSSFSSSYAPLNSLQFAMPNFSRPPLNKYFHLHGNSPFTPLLPLPVSASAAVGVASAPRSFPIKLKSFPCHFHATHPARVAQCVLWWWWKWCCFCLSARAEFTPEPKHPRCKSPLLPPTNTPPSLVVYLTDNNPLSSEDNWGCL